MKKLHNNGSINGKSILSPIKFLFMKTIWVILEEVLKNDGVDPSEWDNFKVYYDMTELEKVLAEYYEEWVTYPNDKFPKDLPKRLIGNRKAQRKYEIFCGGFIYYHDVEFKKYEGKFEHTIFFDWAKRKDKVTIYINKTPTQFNAVPPPPPPPPPPES
jgi:hypothetical protein